MTEQTENLQRVGISIGPIVCRFLESHLHQQFHGIDLYRAVVEQVGFVAPDSPRRIMSDLKNQGVVNYELINRRQSLYVSLPVKGQLKLF